MHRGARASAEGAAACSAMVAQVAEKPGEHKCARETNVAATLCEACATAQRRARSEACKKYAGTCCNSLTKYVAVRCRACCAHAIFAQPRALEGARRLAGCALRNRSACRTTSNEIKRNSKRHLSKSCCAPASLGRRRVGCVTCCRRHRSAPLPPQTCAPALAWLFPHLC